MYRIKIFVFVNSVLIIVACTSNHDNTNHKQKSTLQINSAPKAIPIQEFTPDQQSALNAFNELQVSTDKKNQFYSTFAGSAQPCLLPDTSFSISRSEFLTAIETFVAKHCTNLPIEKQKEITHSAVLAQDVYSVLFCSDNPTDLNFKNGIPMAGTWVIPNILGIRDVVIVWS